YDTRPDRAVLLCDADSPPAAPPLAGDGEASGPAAMIGFPAGGQARAFAGRVTNRAGTLWWLQLERTSHFECINGASGGGVYSESGALIGIQSCTDSRGYVTAVGFTPVAAWDELFTRLGWSPDNWGRDLQLASG